MHEAANQIEDPSICIIRLWKGGRIRGKLAELLNPVDPASFHEFRLAPNTDVELHYHDMDEYWLFRSGHPTVTLRSPSAITKQVELGPGDMVACLRGVEHTLWADHELVYFQFSSIPQGGERSGHLTR